MISGNSDYKAIKFHIFQIFNVHSPIAFGEAKTRNTRPFSLKENRLLFSFVPSTLFSIR